MKVHDLVPWGRNKSDGARGLRRPEKLATHRDDNGGAMQTLRQDINTVFDRFFDRFETTILPPEFHGLGGFSQPSLDISEGRKSLTVSADLPGMEDKDIDISLTGDVLTIRGEREQEHRSDNDGSIVQERSYGAFYRTVQLPSGVDVDGAKAKFKNGVLTVTIPKKAGVKSTTKRIDVRAA